MASFSTPPLDHLNSIRRLGTVTLSVVIPFYNEGANVEALFERIVPALNNLNVSWEIICVNDGSRDDTLPRLLRARQRDPRVKLIDFSRNFGKEVALTAGLAYASGAAVVPMDADLQHPPEVIADMLARWREGYEVVYAVRQDRVGQSTLNRWFAKGFYWVFDNLSEVELPREVGDFRLIDRKVVDVINDMPERSRFMKGIFAWVGFRQIGVPYVQEERHGGESNFPIVKLLRLAFDGLTSFSNFPLKVWGVVGAVVSLLAFIYILVRLLRVLLFGIDVPGYESILMITLFLGGTQLLTLGIIGDYLGRVFDEVKRRPLFVVRAAHGFEPSEESTPALPHAPRDLS